MSGRRPNKLGRLKALPPTASVEPQPPNLTRNSSVSRPARTEVRAEADAPSHCAPNLPGATDVDDHREVQEPAPSGSVDTMHSLPSSPARIAGRSTVKSASAADKDTRLTRWPTDKQMLLFRRRTRARPADDVASKDTATQGSRVQEQGTTESKGGLPDSGTKQPALCSSFPFKTRRHAQFLSESAKFLIVPTPRGPDPDTDFFNVHLVRFFVEQSWKIPRPEVIITVTGGAAHFDLPQVDKDKIMRGMMEGTRHLRPWFITGGTHSGIMKYVGEARAKYNPEAPLIGVAPLGAIGGGTTLRTMCDKQLPSASGLKTSEPKGDLEQWDWNEHEGLWEKAKSVQQSVHLCYEDLIAMAQDHTTNEQDSAQLNLDPNHSHFLLTDEDDFRTGLDRMLRAAFEAAIADNVGAEGKYPIYRFCPDESSLQWKVLSEHGATHGDNPRQGLRQVRHEGLQRALDRNHSAENGTDLITLEKEQCDQFKIPNLCCDHYVQSKSTCFVPDGCRKAARCDIGTSPRMVQFENHRVQRAWVLRATCALQALCMWDQGWQHGPGSALLEGSAPFKNEKSDDGDEKKGWKRDDFFGKLQENGYESWDEENAFWPFWEETGEEAGKVRSALEAIWLFCGKGTRINSTLQGEGELKENESHEGRHRNGNAMTEPTDRIVSERVAPRGGRGGYFLGSENPKKKAQLALVRSHSVKVEKVSVPQLLDVERLRAEERSFAKRAQELWSRNGPEQDLAYLDWSRHLQREVVMEVSTVKTAGDSSTTPSGRMESDTRIFRGRTCNLGEMSAAQVQRALKEKFRDFTWSKKEARSDGVADGNRDADLDSEQTNEAVPLVCVCVQGGKNSVNTVLHAVQNGTPSLLVLGSGKAADLISDAVMLQFPPSHPAYLRHRKPRQERFWEFLCMCDIQAEIAPIDGRYHWGEVIKSIEQHKRLLENAKKDQEKAAESTLHLMIAEQVIQSARDLIVNDYLVVQKGATNEECLQLIVDVLKCAQTHQCWVFDLYSTEPGYDDFNGALLKCLLNGVSRVGQESPYTLKKKLKYTMLWSRDDLMDYLLERVNNDIDEKDKIEIFNDAFLFALKHNKVHAISALFERGTGYSTLDVGNRYCFVKHIKDYKQKQKQNQMSDSKPNGKHQNAVIDCDTRSKSDKGSKDGYESKKVPTSWKKTKHVLRFLTIYKPDQREKERYFKAAQNWNTLIEDALKTNIHFSALWSEHKKAQKEFKNKSKNPIVRLIQQCFLSCLQCLPSYLLSDPSLDQSLDDSSFSTPGHPIPPNVRKQLYCFVSTEKTAKQKPFKDKSGGTPLMTAKDQSELQVVNEKRLSARMILLEGLLLELMGSNFRYRQGIQGPELDIFLWNVLLNKKELAEEMWKHVKHPVRSAITASYMLRQLAKNQYTDAISKTKMHENADFFEQKAIEVQRAAHEDDKDLAIKSVDCELYLYRNMALLDVAAISGSDRFLEFECCTQAIDYRLYGDLNPTQFENWFGFFKFFVSVITLGLPLLFPRIFTKDFLLFTPPPESQVLRRRSQRRNIPLGYPHFPSENPILKRAKETLAEKKDLSGKDKKLLHLLELKDSEVKNITAQQLATLWAPTFLWKKRWSCFILSPYTLFVLNGLQTMMITALLLIWFMQIRLVQPRKDHLTRLPHKTPEIAPSDEFFGPWFRHAMFYYFLASLFREVLQFCVDCIGVGVWAYIYDSGGGLDLWNIIDILTPVSYFIGYDFHESCLENVSKCSVADSFLPGGAKIELWSLFYALAIFFSLTRVLRVFYISTIGIIINIFLSNFNELSKFATIYVILLCGIAALFIGAGDYTSLMSGDCSESTNSTTKDLLLGAPESGIISCHAGYAIVRPLFQSFGEFALGEMTNSASIILVVMTFVFLNLMLMNLLIAMMTSTYESKSSRAKRDLLLYKYQIIEEHSRRVVAIPVPFNVFYLLYEMADFWWEYKALKHLLPDCTWSQRLDSFLSRNQRPSRIAGADYNKHPALHIQIKNLLSFSWHQKMKDEDQIPQTIEADQLTQARLSAFMERARAVVINKVPPKDSMDYKVDSIAVDVRHIQEITEGIRSLTNTMQGGGKMNRSQKAKERNRENAQKRWTIMREKGHETGKKALYTKKLLEAKADEGNAVALKMQKQLEDPQSLFRSKQQPHGHHNQDRDVDDGELLKQYEAEVRALRVTNSRLMTMLGQKCVDSLSAFERRPAGSDPHAFKSALQAIRFAETIMRGGEDDSETLPGHDREQLCEDCPEGQDRPAVWYCLQCDAHLCQACHDHHSRSKRTSSHETHRSGYWNRQGATQHLTRQ